MADYWASSSATGGGTGSISDEWTLAEGLGASGVAEGDRLLVKADGTYSLSTKITVAISSYDFEDAPIVIGANSSGVVDGTIPVINGSGITSDDILLLSQSGTRIHLKNIRFTAATASAIRITTAIGGSSGITIENCRIDNCTGSGIVDEETSFHPLQIIDCEIDNNGANGLETPSSLFVNNSSFHDNTTDGISVSGTFSAPFVVSGCLIYNNGVKGIDIGIGSGYVIIGNVFFNNDNDGLELSDSQGFIICTNNIFRSNGVYGIGGPTLDSQFTYIDHNCYSNNTSGAVSWNSGTPPGDNNITSDPKFTSETDGSEDFTLQSDSPCIDAGFGYDGAA